MENLETDTSTKKIEYIQIPRSSKDDIVCESFNINIQEEILPLSNDFCKYYNATSSEDGRKFFAIAYDHGFVPPIQKIEFLSKHTAPHLNQVITYGLTRLSSTKLEHVVVIVNQYNYENSLENYAKNNSLSFEQVQDIINKVRKLLEFLQQSNIYCANINPSNIIMQNNEMFLVREFIDSYPNFYQEPGYIAPEFLECHRFARYHESPKGDIFALAVTIFYAITGAMPWTEHKTPESYYTEMLQDSCYKYLLEKGKIPSKIKPLLKAMLEEDATKRLNLTEIGSWLNGENPKFLHESISDGQHQLIFNKKEYSNTKSLLYGLFQNWEEAIQLLKDQKVYKWIAHQSLAPEVLEEVNKIATTDSNTPFVITNAIKSNYKMTRLFAVLDPEGALRCDKIGLSPSMIPTLLHHLLIAGKKNLIEQILKIIHEETWNNYNLKGSVGHIEPEIADSYKKSIVGISPSGVVNGFERLIYSLNPYAKCISPILNGHYVTSMRDLILSLEHFAETNPKHLNIDRNILAFLASRLDLKSEIRSSILSNFPKLSNHPVIVSLNALNLLQQSEAGIEIPHICQIIAQELCDLMNEYLHSSSFKQEINLKINEAAKSGDLSKIVQIFANQQPFVNDHNGYHLASKKAAQLKDQIQKLSHKDHIFNNALLLGQKTTVFISYILCFIVTITVIL